MSNYVIYHLHSDLSNGVTNIDSVTKYKEYVQRAKECGMKAMAFAEHGSVFEWWHKKCDIEAAGMKYIHAVEAYLTEDLDGPKVRDNYHCVLLAKNYEGFLELNRMISRSFCRTDNHFYYVPRIGFEELFATSDNIIVTTACVGGVLGKAEQDGTSDSAVAKYLDFLIKNKHRCYLEIGHHPDEKQKSYNTMLYELHKQIGVPLIAGTDTHVLNEEHEKGRSVLQKAKGIRFDNEDGWDLKFKTYEELVAAYEKQGVLPKQVYLEAIENTNVMAEGICEFKIDCGTKYPAIYENPEQVFRSEIESALKTHPYATKNHQIDELRARIDAEFDVYKATGSTNFMLLQTYLRRWELENGIQCGYSRGSVSGSMIAYILGITQMDSMRFGLNFFRFMNPGRVSNADIDTDYGGEDRERVKQYLLRDKMGISSIRTAEIITFNTIALKGAIRDVCRGLYKDRADIDYLKIADKIVSEADSNEEKARKKYPEVFKYVDIVNGTIVSVGTHPSGVLVSDLPIDERVGLCSISSSEYPVSMINMKELDDQFYVKLDVLGLDNIAVINNTCKMLGIERLTPDNVDLEDEKVWKSIRDDTTLIFQWESNSAQQYLKRFMSDQTLEIARKNIPNFSTIKWLSFGNGLLRPACASFRDNVARGEFYDNGFDALNEFLAPEAGRIAMQETIMKFLVQFCGYTNAESDTVRRAIAKKRGTDTLLPEIKRRFIEYTTQNYGLTSERASEIIEPFIQIILDASAYTFSWNHSDSYSCIGYISGYLRYYYPLEFLTAALNVFSDNTEKTAEIIRYAGKLGIKVTAPRWGVSGRNYFFNRERNMIAKGLTAVKYMSAGIADELSALAESKRFVDFMDLLVALQETSINSRQLDILIKIDFFSDFGNQRELLKLVEIFDMFNHGESKKISKEKIDGTPLQPVVEKYAVGVTKSGGEAKSYTLIDVMAILKESEEVVKNLHIEDLDDITKIRNFKEVMGYVGNISDKAEDRRKLYVLDVYPIHRKRDGAQFAYSVVTRSIGSGKEARFTVFNRVYNTNPIQKDDVIYCQAFVQEGPYYRLTEYSKIAQGV